MGLPVLFIYNDRHTLLDIIEATGVQLTGESIGTVLSKYFLK